MSTIALSSALSYLAIGLGDGTVLLYRHLDQSIYSTSSNLTTMPKPRSIHESPTEPITGLGFKEPDEENANIYLFIVTTNHVLSYQVTGRGSGNTPAVVDEVGSGLGCATMSWRDSEMVVAKDEAVYICGTEGRGACYAYEGELFDACLPSLLRHTTLQVPKLPSTSTGTIWSSSLLHSLLLRQPHLPQCETLLSGMRILLKKSLK